jgi:hypothetical protein
MLFTSLAVTVAVAGVAPSLTSTSQPKWQPDYPTAVRVAAAQHKPLAVFVGHGQAGFARLVTDGGPAAPVAQALSEKFVSVYVDADSPAGKPLAQALKVTDGLVISDRTGTVVALRHQGPVAPAALTSYVTTYTADQPVVQTVQAGTLAPVVAAPVFAAPVYAPSFGGGCANGQCGPRPFGGFVGNVFGGLTGGGCANGQCGRPTLFR